MGFQPQPTQPTDPPTSMTRPDAKEASSTVVKAAESFIAMRASKESSAVVHCC